MKKILFVFFFFTYSYGYAETVNLSCKITGSRDLTYSFDPDTKEVFGAGCYMEGYGSCKLIVLPNEYRIESWQFKSPRAGTISKINRTTGDYQYKLDLGDGRDSSSYGTCEKIEAKDTKF